MATASGRFLPRFPDKYTGDVSKIFFRSSWELSMMKFLDSSTAVVKWGSEEIKIPYIKPTDNKVHYYYPDFFVIYRDKNGSLVRELIEVKPLKETLVEKAKTDYDKVSLIINAAKWKAAEAFASKHNMKFRVITERSMFAQGKQKSKVQRNKK